MTLTTTTSSNADFDVDVNNDDDVFSKLIREEVSTAFKDLISNYQSKANNFKILQNQYKTPLKKL